ncbi:MAG: type II toxin-antitoxin system antitoxin SocA domain-containing protein [Cyanobacteria bacterium P01_C01_bin.38]
MVKAQDIAEYFIWLANDSGSFISNLKLQKLVYYAQAWYLAIYGQPLFDEDFEAWVHGPIIPSLYQKYREFNRLPIVEEISYQQLAQKLGDTIHFLQDVADEYFFCDAYELERMTHIEDPWIQARKGLPNDVPSNVIIDKEWMKEYYGSRVKEEA